MDSSSSDEEEIKPNFRIRFTIRNSGSPTSSEVFTRRSCNEDPRDHPQSEANHRCNHQIDISSRVNNSGSPINDQNKKKAFQIVQPQNHKSSLFVNLSEIGSLPQQDSEKSLFISPDLNKLAPETPPTSADSTIRSVSIAFSQTDASPTLEDNQPITTEGNRMSQACNLFNSLMLASMCPTRNRSVSTSPATEECDTSGNRRASSSNNLTTPDSLSMDRSSSGHHLAVGESNETLCDHTQKNRSYVQHSDMTQPLQVLITEPTRELDFRTYPVSMNTDHPISIDDILQIDIDNSRLEDECKNLQNQVELWEQRVDELEKQRFDKDVPRTLVENVLCQRKKLRELEFQVYTLNLKSEDAKKYQERRLPSPDRANLCISRKGHRSRDSNVYPPLEDSHKSTSFASSPMGNKISASKVGSFLRPGQENTADILDAIPPSGSLQYRQYLSRATTGTDSSGYSQLPFYDKLRQQTGTHAHVLNGSDVSSNVSTGTNNPQGNWRVNNHHTQSQSEDFSGNRRTSVDSCQSAIGVEAKESPVRPNHFKPIYRSNREPASQDSSSTASSGSPY